MNEDQIKTFGEKLNDKIEAKYQAILKDKLDLIFHGPDGTPRPNGMVHKMQTVLTKKWKVEKLSTVTKFKVKRKIQKRLGWPIKFLSDFCGGYAIVAIMYDHDSPDYTIVDKEGNIQLRNRVGFKPQMLMGHILMHDGYGNSYVFDETHDGEERIYSTLEGDFHEGLARTKDSQNFVDADGKYIFNQDLYYGEFSDFHEGYALFKYGDQIDYMDRNGNFMFGSIVKKSIQTGWHDYDDFPVWDGESPYEDGGDFHEGYARVKKDGKWNLMDYQGKLVFKEFYDDISDVEFGSVTIKNEGKEQTVFLDMKNYRVSKVHDGYECANFHETINIKYQPIKNYNIRYLLCTDKKNYYIYDKFLKKEILLGPVDKIIYDDNFIYDMTEQKMYLIYGEEIIDITEYYMENLKDKETISISSKVTGIISRDVFRLKNNDEIEKITQEAREENARIIEEQRKEKQRKEVEQLKTDSEQSERERLENLRKALADMKDARERVLKYSKPGPPEKRIYIADLFDQEGDHLVIAEDFRYTLKNYDISAETFANVDVEGVDFSDCNPNILDPQLVYKKSLRGCHFDRVYINPFINFEGVDIRGCTFTNDNNALTMDVFNQSFERAKYDSTTKYNNRPIAEVIEETKVSRKAL